MGLVRRGRVACFSLEDYMTRRLKKRFPNIKFV